MDNRVIYTGKAGRPVGSGSLGIYADNKKEYNKKYYAKKRYVFSVNLHKDKDKELIEILENYMQGNRQGAVKELCLIGYKFVKDLGCLNSSELAQKLERLSKI